MNDRDVWRMDEGRPGGRGPRAAMGGVRDLPALGPMREVPMFRMILIVAFALVVGSGAIIAAAQGGTGSTEAPEAGAQAGCGTPVAALMTSPEASPELGIAKVVERSLSSTAEAVDALATAAEVVEATPAVQEQDGCATPEAGTPAS